jgi:hypothetical protein
MAYHPTSSIISGTGHGFRQDGLYFIQQDAFGRATRKILSVFAFFAGTLDEIADIKVESVSYGGIALCALPG